MDDMIIAGLGSAFSITRKYAYVTSCPGVTPDPFVGGISKKGEKTVFFDENVTKLNRGWMER